MNEDFVPFELAVKLKEKGYPQHICECAYIMEDDEEEENYVVGDREHIEFIPDYLQTMAAPTISQVLKWLRNEKKIYFEVVIAANAEYMCDIYKINPRPIKCLGSTEYSIKIMKVSLIEVSTILLNEMMYYHKQI